MASSAGAVVAWGRCTETEGAPALWPWMQILRGVAAASDPQIGRALGAIHHNPRRSWTVESLARHVAMSRTTFAARFKELVGEPPQHYFTRLRINAAAARLLSNGDKLSRVAAEAGYRSVPAFVRSFKRQIGTTPGEYRNCRGEWPL